MELRRKRLLQYNRYAEERSELMARRMDEGGGGTQIEFSQDTISLEV